MIKLGETVSVTIKHDCLAVLGRESMQYVGGVRLSSARRIDEKTYGGILESYTVDSPAHINRGYFEALNCTEDEIILENPSNSAVNVVDIDAVETECGRFGFIASVSFGIEG